MKKLPILVAALFLPALAVQADAKSVFNQLDTDANGLVSQAEAKAMPELLEAFERLDKDGDKQISLSEFAAYQKG